MLVMVLKAVALVQVVLVQVALEQVVVVLVQVVLVQVALVQVALVQVALVQVALVQVSFSKKLTSLLLYFTCACMVSFKCLISGIYVGRHAIIFVCVCVCVSCGALLAVGQEGRELE